MSRYPWRDTSTDIAGGQPPQWETPQGAQAKADEALKESKEYTDEQNAGFTEHIQDAAIHVTPADKANWNSKAPGVHTHANATPTVPGFMSVEDYTKLKGVEAEANKYVHPATHPPAIIAQDTGNRFVSDAEKAAWSGKAEITEATTVAKGLMSPTDKQKLNGIQAAAEVNQNAFSGVNGVVATSKSDTLQLTGGTGITITEDAATKRLTVTATGDATPGAHASSHITGGTDVIPDAVIGGSSGLMSGADAKFVRQDGESKTEAQAKADAALVAANEYTDGKVAEIVIDDASLTQKGIVQLSNATSGNRDTVAATESAVSTVQQQVDNLEEDLNETTLNYIRQPGYAVTTGTSTAYAVTLNPAPTSLPDGFGITVVPHVDNGATPTLNVNGLGAVPLKDQKGVAFSVGKLIAGRPYTFRKVGTDFLADSSGGSGNAVAGDIRAGKTATNDGGDVTGNVVVRNTSQTNITPTTSAQTLQPGIYDYPIVVNPTPIAVQVEKTGDINVPGNSSVTLNPAVGKILAVLLGGDGAYAIRLATGFGVQSGGGMFTIDPISGAGTTVVIRSTYGSSALMPWRAMGQ